MVEEMNLPPGGTRRAKVAPPMEHGALEEILPVGNDMKNNTPYFQFTSF